MKSISQEDTIVTATGDGKFTTCAEEDIAEVGADALSNPKSYNRDVFILGPEFLNFDQVRSQIPSSTASLTQSNRLPSCLPKSWGEKSRTPRSRRVN